MFPRRRLNGTAHSSETGSTGAIRLGHLDSIGAAYGRGAEDGQTIGASYISSSSSTSSGSSSPVLNPVRRSLRVESRRRTTATLQHSLSRSLARRRSRQSVDLTAQRGSHSWADPSLSSSSAQVRSAVSVNSKPMNRTRRRALLRSPIVRLILSSNGASPPCQTNSLNQSSTSVAGHSPHERSSRRGVDDSVRILHTEGVDDARSTRPRTTRSGTRATRTNPLARRRSQQSRTSTAPPNRVVELSSQLDSQVTVDSDEFRAVLNATRTGTGDGDDECVICLDPKANRSIVLPCMHTFCFECIYRWLCINPSCPLCKRLAHRLIHSILSDSDFTETLVSELQSQRNANGTHRVTGLPPGFDLEEEDNPTTGQQSHHHFHYHLEAAPVRFLDYLGGMAHHRTSTGPPLFIPPILIPSESPLSRTSPIATVLNSSGVGSRRIPYRWSTEYDSSAETHRSLLIDLVNNALRPRFSSLLDGMLLRQLVYVFGFDSLPVSQEPQLERDISPSFLADNEAQRHRLEAFVRRELRVLAPWLAYQPNDSLPASVLREHSDAVEREQPIPAVTSPLICGAPGLLAETPELDSITSRVVQHFTSVSMTDEPALVDLLSSFPSLRPPLVPATYLSHFASEVVQFARYTGTLDQYDSAVCLYRRRVSTALSSRLQDRSRPRRPDPRLAVYVASACWPRLRPGFAQPQGLITHPLNTWLLQRLFVHSVTGSTHPARLSGTGESPPTLPERIVFQPLSSPTCHPNCMRLSSISRALLGALPSLARMRSQATSRPVDSPTNERYDDSLSQLGSGVTRRMTTTELYPNRLLYQRVLSELIDQARFSEALSEYFHQYLSAREQRNNTAPVDLTEPDDSSTTEIHSTALESHVNSSNRTETVSTILQPALKVHPLALRRLNGLLLLFTARIPGLGSSASADDEEVEDWLSELLHLPLLHMTVPSPVVDLTSSSSRPSRTRRRPAELSNLQSSFSGADWTFLRQLPWDSISSVPEGGPVSRPTLTTASETSSALASFFSSLRSQAPSLSFSPENVHPSSEQNEPPTASRTSPPVPESGWRNSTPSCVIISSDSSSSVSSDNEDRALRTSTMYPLTTDEESASEPEATSRESRHRTPRDPPSQTAENVLINIDNFHDSLAVTISEARPSENPAIREIETDAGNLSLNQKPTTSTAMERRTVSPEPDNLVVHQEEPMEVDERSEDTAVFPLPFASGSKRPARITTSDSTNDAVSDSNDPRYPSKLAKLEAYFSGLPREWQQILLMRASESLQPSLVASRSSQSRRMRYGGSTRHHVSRSRSPVYVNDTDDSDCELLREYINVDSDSYSSFSSFRSSSSSASSTSESVSPVPSPPNRSRRARSRSRIRRAGKHETSKSHRHRPCRHCRKHRARHHRRSERHEQHSRSYCCASRLHRHRHRPHTTSRKRYHHNRIALRPRPAPVNTPLSPILISDDNDDHSNVLLSAPAHTADVGSSQQLHLTVDECVSHKTSNDVVDGNSKPSDKMQPLLSSPIESTSVIQVDDKQVQDTSSSTNLAYSPLSTCSSSTVPTLPIFEPSTMDDFYRFLERFDASANGERASEPLASATHPDVCLKVDSESIYSERERTALPSSPHVFPIDSPNSNANTVPITSPAHTPSDTT